MTDYERIKREYDLSLLQKDRLMSKVYPVGSIYMSINEVSPSALFGGVWERIENAFLLAASKAHPAGETGGAETHTLTVDEMPSHSHPTYMRYWGSGPDTIPQWAWYFNDSAYAEANPAVASGRKDELLVQAKGKDQPHNNMPPYLSVYMWVRIK